MIRIHQRTIGQGKDDHKPSHVLSRDCYIDYMPYSSFPLRPEERTGTGPDVGPKESRKERRKKSSGTEGWERLIWQIREIILEMAESDSPKITKWLKIDILRKLKTCERKRDTATYFGKICRIWYKWFFPIIYCRKDGSGRRGSGWREKKKFLYKYIKKQTDFKYRDTYVRTSYGLSTVVIIIFNRAYLTIGAFADSHNFI